MKDDEGNSEMWISEFQKEHLTKDEISKLSHDDHMWYYMDIPTCVAYGGDSNSKCNIGENVCSDTSTEKAKVGTPNEQVREVIKSIKNNLVHPDCPLLYPGGD